MHLDVTIGWHKRFALLWINEAGILTIQVAWLIAEIEFLPPIDLERFDLEPARAPIDLEPDSGRDSDLEPATIGRSIGRAPIDLEPARSNGRAPIDLEPATIGRAAAPRSH